MVPVFFFAAVSNCFNASVTALSNPFCCSGVKDEGSKPFSKESPIFLNLFT